MTASDLAAELFARQGYLVGASDNPKKVGDRIETLNATGIPDQKIPVRIVAMASWEEWQRQNELIPQITGIYVQAIPRSPLYLYKIEALD